MSDRTRPPNNRWEFSDEAQMLSLLIGKNFGPNPSERLEEIRLEKAAIAEGIRHELSLGRSDDVLEIGSGTGFISRCIAPHARTLHCCDISESFLKSAASECSGLENTHFHLIRSTKLDFLAPESVDAVFSYNVFIHFNLFDIHQYLGEISRVLRPGGRLWFDTASADAMRGGIPALFYEMIEYYKREPDEVKTLVQWNSREAVIALGRSHGLQLRSVTEGDSFLFFKPQPLDSSYT